jgi:hypothetical protein
MGGMVGTETELKKKELKGFIFITLQSGISGEDQRKKPTQYKPSVITITRVPFAA